MSKTPTNFRGKSFKDFICEIIKNEELYKKEMVEDFSFYERIVKVFGSYQNPGRVVLPLRFRGGVTLTSFLSLVDILRKKRFFVAYDGKKGNAIVNNLNQKLKTLEMENIKEIDELNRTIRNQKDRIIHQENSIADYIKRLKDDSGSVTYSPTLIEEHLRKIREQKEKIGRQERKIEDLQYKTNEKEYDDVPKDFHDAKVKALLVEVNGLREEITLLKEGDNTNLSTNSQNPEMNEGVKNIREENENLKIELGRLREEHELEISKKDDYIKAYKSQYTYSGGDNITNIVEKNEHLETELHGLNERHQKLTIENDLSKKRIIQLEKERDGLRDVYNNPQRTIPPVTAYPKGLHNNGGYLHPQPKRTIEMEGPEKKAIKDYKAMYDHYKRTLESVKEKHEVLKQKYLEGNREIAKMKTHIEKIERQLKIYMQTYGNDPSIVNKLKQEIHTLEIDLAVQKREAKKHEEQSNFYFKQNNAKTIKIQTMEIDFNRTKISLKNALNRATNQTKKVEELNKKCDVAYGQIKAMEVNQGKSQARYYQLEKRKNEELQILRQGNQAEINTAESNLNEVIRKLKEGKKEVEQNVGKVYEVQKTDLINGYENRIANLTAKLHQHVGQSNQAVAQVKEIQEERSRTITTLLEKQKNEIIKEKIRSQKKIDIIKIEHMREAKKLRDALTIAKKEHETKLEGLTRYTLEQCEIMRNTLEEKYKDEKANFELINKDLNQYNKELSDIINERDATLKKTKENLETAQEHARAHNIRIITITNENKTEINEKNKNIKTLQGEILKKDDKIIRLEGRIRFVERERDDFKNKFNQSQHDLALSKGKCRSLEEEITKRNNTIQDFKMRVNDLAILNKSLKGKVKEIKDTLDDLRTRSLLEKQSNLVNHKNLIVERDSCKHQHDQIKKVLEKKEKDLKVLSGKHENLIIEHKELTSEFSTDLLDPMVNIKGNKVIETLKKILKSKEENTEKFKLVLMEFIQQYLDMPKPIPEGIFAFDRKFIHSCGDIMKIGLSQRVVFSVQFKLMNPVIRKDIIQISGSFEDEFKNLGLEILINRSKIENYEVFSAEGKGLKRSIKFIHEFKNLGKQQIRILLKNSKIKPNQCIFLKDAFVIKEIRGDPRTSFLKVLRRDFGGSKTTSSSIFRNDGTREFLIDPRLQQDLMEIVKGQGYVNDPIYVQVCLRSPDKMMLRPKNVKIVVKHQRGEMDDYVYTFKPNEWSKKSGFLLNQGIALPIPGLYTISVLSYPSLNIVLNCQPLSKRVKVRLDGDTQQVRDFGDVLARHLQRNHVLADIYESRYKMGNVQPDIVLHLNGRSLTPLIDDDAVRNNVDRLVNSTTTKSAIYIHLVPRMSAGSYKKFGKIRDQPKSDNFKSVVFYGQFIPAETYDDVYFPMDGGLVVQDMECFGEQMNQLIRLISSVRDEVMNKFGNTN